MSSTTPRVPVELKILNGAYKINPSRARPIGAKSEQPLGKPPAYLTAAERAVWRELVAHAPPGILTQTDGVIVEVVSRLLAKFRADWLTGAEMSQMINCLGRLGWSPSDRQRVAANPAKKPDDGLDFLN